MFSTNKNGDDSLGNEKKNKRKREVVQANSINRKKRINNISLNSKELKNIVKNIIDKYNLKVLDEDENLDYNNLDENRKETIVLGLIKLGEALTFARYNQGINSDVGFSREGKYGNLSAISYKFSNLRNYLIHHLMYEKKLEDKYMEIKARLKSLPKINLLIQYIEQMEDDIMLKKLSAIGYNKFPFHYEHHLVTLENELEIIENIAEDSEITAKAENHVRNCLCIILDLTSENSQYLVSSFSEDRQEFLKKKSISKAINAFSELISSDNMDVLLLLSELKTKRNNLSHFLNKSSATAINEIPEMVKGLLGLKKLNFIKLLNQVIVKKETDPLSETKITLTTKKLQFREAKSTPHSLLSSVKVESLMEKDDSTILPQIEEAQSDMENPLSALTRLYSEKKSDKDDLDKTRLEEDFPKPSFSKH